MLPLTGFVSLSDRIQARPSRPTPERTISVVSLNLAKETDSTKLVSAIRNTARLRDADLFLFQEVASDGSHSSVAEKTARELGYFASFMPAASNVYDQGLALVSRYEISSVQIRGLKAFNLGFRSRSRFAITGTVRSPWGDLRVWNAHLDTRINAAARLEQLQPIIEEASRQAEPQLIGGDFNTNELYWLRNVMPLPGGRSHRAMIRNAMKQNGFETPLADALDTFPALRRHLDWIYCRGLSPLESSVETTPFSDHNAIWVRVGL